MLQVFTLFIFSFYFLTIFGQDYFPVNGMKEVAQKSIIIKNAFVTTHYNQEPRKLDIHLIDHKIVEVGENLKKKGTEIIDLEGYYIYPSFIDIFSNYGIEEAKSKPTQRPQYETSKQGAYHWNETIKSEVNAYELINADKVNREKYLKGGIGTVLSHSMDGIARGTGALVFLGNENLHSIIAKDKAAQCLSFSKGSSAQQYPSSLMGIIALIRQTYYDAEYYNKQKNEPLNLSLQSWNQNATLPVVFDAGNDPFNVLRASKIAQEFNQKYIIKSTGKEYRILDEVKATNSILIVPVNFPKAYDFESDFDANYLFLSQLKHWELAPYNPALLSHKQIPFVFTANGSKDGAEFLENIRKAVQLGLDKTEALKALTYLPAQLLGVEDKVGSLEKGKMANFFVTDKPVFDKGATIHQHWVLGKKDEFKPLKEVLPDGNYTIKIEKNSFDFEVKNSEGKLKLADSIFSKATFKLQDEKLFVQIHCEKDSTLLEKGFYLFFGWEIEKGKYSGLGNNPNGKQIKWSIQLDSIWVKEVKEEKKTEKETLKIEDILSKILYPFESYGRQSLPKAERVLFKNATVWTNEKEGILEKTDVLISNGKIISVGKNIEDKSAINIDATGKHLTSGIIDEHSHISITGGVNEGGQSNTAEVRIGDVIRNDDINMYRQLAGGVVAAQLLHGSANAIGGQSAIIKYRWGKLPEDMKIKEAPEFIKFALGENVKQANWGENFTSRYPQSRMGVEQTFREYFTRAKEYMIDNKGRKDLELDALVEILQGKRFISCHSYIQSEINMLMKVAEDFGFKVNTFTHILEGFKVADKMENHGAGASTFADWWAYKYEVIDAIPYNAAILEKMGVVTAINSDDAEMGRRLNQEAAKAVKYGGVSEEAAWKMVTLNPAKLLHIDQITGSIKVGKDADLVLWSHNPLSVYASAEMTFVDGVKYFDRKEDEMLRSKNEAERNRLIQLMLAEKKSGSPTQRPEIIIDEHYHCDDIKNWEDEHENHDHE